MWSGITAALTGPPASTYAPAVEALRIYVDRVNAAGGVDGKKINLVIEDDSAQPSKAAANAKKLLTEDNPVLMLNASLSSTYAPVIAEAKNAGVPLMFASSVCPKDVYPPAQRRRVLHHGLRRELRQPRSAVVRQGNREGAGQDRLCRHGDSAVARRDRFCRKPASGAGHDRGRQGDHSAADRGLHAVCDQDQGSGRQLGVLLGAVGDAGAHLRGVAATRLVRRLYRLGRISTPRTSSSASRIRSSTSSAPMRCSRTRCRSRRRSSTPPSRPAANIRRTR